MEIISVEAEHVQGLDLRSEDVLVLETEKGPGHRSIVLVVAVATDRDVLVIEGISYTKE